MRPIRFRKPRPAHCGALLLIFAASALQSVYCKPAPRIDSSQVVAPRPDPQRLQSSELQEKVAVVRKAALPEIGPGCKRAPSFQIRRSPVAIERRAIRLPPERGETFADLTLPTYLRAYLSGAAPCRRDPPA